MAQALAPLQRELRRQHGAANYFRFMPMRKPQKRGDGRTDGRIVLNGARYAETAMAEAAENFSAGVAVGPGVHNPVGAAKGFDLTPGSMILPAFASADRKTIGVREFKFTDELGQGQKRLFADKVSIVKQADGSYRAMPRGKDEKDVVYFEVWTGDVHESHKSFQLINAGLFQHGSVEYSGGSVLVDAVSKKRATKKERDNIQILSGVEADAAQSNAELVAELPGIVVGGIVLWSVRLWKVKFSPKQSECVLVRHFERFFLLRAPSGIVPPDDKLEVPATDFEKTFKRLSSQVYVPGATPVPTAAAA